MTTPVHILLQFICEDPADFEVVHQELKQLPLSKVTVVRDPSTPVVEKNLDRYQIEVVVPYFHSTQEPVLATALDALEQIALSAESVVPETVRATLSTPPKDPLITGEYVDFLEAKVDHLMIRTLNLQMQADDTAQDLADGLQAAAGAAERCESVYTSLEQQGALHFSALFEHLAKAIEDITGNNPLTDFEAAITIH